jgi:hypothetical protein
VSFRRGLAPYDPRSGAQPFPFPGAPETPSGHEIAPPVGDVGTYVLPTLPEYIAGSQLEPHDPVGLTLVGVLVDILKVLLGTYNLKGRPEQINISPGFRGISAKLNSHVRLHVSRIKGSGAPGSRVDIMVGTEVVESIYNVTGMPYDVAASFWIDRGQDVSSVDGLTGSVLFSCVLIASEAD